MNAGANPAKRDRPVLHVLTGCTAVGKTDWALRWAEARGAEILSCDSLLFYRSMDIGTAKPSREERARVPHHLIDIRPVDEPMNVARYVELAQAAARDIAARGKAVLVVGGSGFYLKAFFAPVADGEETPASVRSGVAERLAEGGVAGVLAELHRLNPGGLGALDTANPRRVTRALERCLASGRTLAELAEAFARTAPPFAGWEVRAVRLERPAADLDRRIEGRVAAMLAGGLVEEVERLVAGGGLRLNPSAARAIGYREVIAVLEGRLERAALAAEIARNTRALVKKQRTWFRTQLPAHQVVDAGALTDTGELFGTPS